MKYDAQHNGIGKYHLIGEDDVECGSSGMFNFTKSEEVLFENGQFFEFYNGNKKLISDFLLDSEYCKKCVNKIKKKFEIKYEA